MTNTPLDTAANTATISNFEILQESAKFTSDIADLHETAFGPGRFTRAAFRVREQGPFDADLSFVAVEKNDVLLGSARLTWVGTKTSQSRGLLLGPLAVISDAQNRGIGRALVAQCVKASAETDASFLMLVGDHPYYGPLGFEIAPKNQVLMPGPVDTNRLLVCPLNGFDVSSMVGLVGHEDTIFA